MKLKKVKIIKSGPLGEEGKELEVSEDIFALYRSYLKEIKDYKNKMMKKNRVKTK